MSMTHTFTSHRKGAENAEPEDFALRPASKLLLWTFLDR